jgi:hypothetical protein
VFIPVLSWTQTQGPADAAPPVYIVLWFDTEDYTRTDPDTILLPLCEILERQGIRATFKMVGEKARQLEHRGQKDVIAALSRHDIGFHTTFHSLPPVPTAYLDRLDWSDGVEEFIRREEPGFLDTKRIFGRTPICYGQPGSAWAPQVFGALRRWQVPMYLDEGTHVGLKGRPFYYGGLLNVYDMADFGTRMNLEGSGDYQKAMTEFRRLHARLTSEGGGLISIYYHPNEFDCTEFWDAVIWSHGANPPRDKWRQPGKRSPESRAEALRYFEMYLESMRNMPGVRFVGAGDLIRLYADRSAGRRFKQQEVLEIARLLATEVTYQVAGGVYLSPAECMSVMLRWYLRDQGTLSVEAVSGLLGPARREPGVTGLTVDEWQFSSACRDALDYINRTGHVPSVVWLGSSAVAPADFLASLAAKIADEKSGDHVAIRQGRFTGDKYAANDEPGLFDWIIFPTGFRAPHVVDLAKLQCWSFKPAQRNDDLGPAPRRR